MPFADELLRFVEQFGYLALFVIVLIEESGIPMPIPGDGLMIFAGYSASTGRLSFPLAYLVIELATLIGASLLRWLGQRGGHYLLLKYGRWLHLDAERIKRAERWFARHGTRAIVLGRLVPGLRIATSFMAGTFEVPYRAFLPGVALGSSIYILFFMALGLGLGREADDVFRLIRDHPLRSAGAAMAVLFLVALVAWLRQRRGANPS